MLDIKFIRQNPDKVKESLEKRNMKTDIVDQLLAVDKKRREIITELEGFQAQKNKASKIIVRTKDPKEKKKIIAGMKEFDVKSEILNKEMKELNTQFESIIIMIPNIPDDDVPVGKDESHNVVLQKVGKLPVFDFELKDHLKIGKNLDLIDTETAAKVSGSRFSYLKNEAALLEYAIVKYVFDVLTDSKIIKEIASQISPGYHATPFIPVVPPVMIRPDVYIKMARLDPAQAEERYYLPKDDLYLIGSAEHTLGPLHMDEIIPEEKLPIRYIGFSTSFRREAGSYGKDTKGILRVHQFDKLEMESFTLPEDSRKEQGFIVAVQEYLVQALGIPYQVVAVCTGDMGGPDARQIDIECFMPGQGKYRETHTSDMNTDYQSRRLNIKVRRKGGKTQLVHMNDATAFAIGRILIAILENYQQKDGSVVVPEVLRKYAGFDKISKKD
jgi:seryl-tRNA synthetase